MDHFYRHIDGYMGFEALYRQQVERAPADRPSLFVELGTLKGRSAAFLGVEILNSGKPIHVDTWDLWVGTPPGRYHRIEEKGDDLRAAAEQALTAVSPVVKVRTGDAITAAAEYADDSCNFVFVDDCHDYEHVLAELPVWWPKVAPGGLFAGHDWAHKLWPGVRRAVQEWASANGVAIKVDPRQDVWYVARG